ncbi:MAG: hypothetical protein AB1714_19885 [Acidobacteriota bacterium]
MPFSALENDPADTISGTCERPETADSDGDIDALLLNDGRVKLEGHATWIGNVEVGSVHTGDFKGIAVLKGKRVEFVSDEGGEYACRLTLTFDHAVLTVSDDNLQCGGLNVIFDGEYHRIGPPKFDEDE